MTKTWSKDEILRARTWPVKQARPILERMEKMPSDKPILLEMGYGPSGTPHLGTATELIRNFMIAEVLTQLTERKVIIIAFIDDVDGMRKIPPNLPNQELLKEYLGHPLYLIPDSYGSELSFSEVNVKKFREVVKNLGYEMQEYRPTKSEKYSQQKLLEIASAPIPIILLRSSDMYKSGSFDEALNRVLIGHQDILNVILPTLGLERQATYSPFMPISQKSGRVLEVAVKKYYAETGEIEIEDEREIFKIPVNGQTCKLQWKVDFGMRWYRLDVDYEMSGKDIDIGTNPIARKVCTIMGKEPPINWMYEMFLAADGTKISKTKGNGISLDEMLKYMPVPTIRHFMFLSPEKAKRLDVLKIPRYIDDFLADLAKFYDEKTNTDEIDPRLENPIFYSRNSKLLPGNINAAMTLNLIRGLNFPNADELIKHLQRNLHSFNMLDEEVVKCMYRFYNDHYEPPNFVPLSNNLRKYLKEFIPHISNDAEDMQYHLYRLGNEAIAGSDVTDLRTWFKVIYQAILGQEDGRRLGHFLAICGVDRAITLITSASDENELK